MSRVRRILLAAICAVAFGVVCTYVTGWASMLGIAREAGDHGRHLCWHVSSRNPSDHITLTKATTRSVDVYRLQINNFNDSRGLELPEKRFMHIDLRPVAPNDLPMPRFARRHLPLTISSSDSEMQPGVYWHFVVAGRPLRAIYGFEHDTSDTTPVRHWAVDLPTMTSGQQAGARLYFFPLRPIFPGFILNTLFYAAIGLTVWFSPGLIRRSVRRSRRARGRCPACGYDLRNLPATTCPECGKTSPPQPRTADPGLD